VCRFGTVSRRRCEFFDGHPRFVIADVCCLGRPRSRRKPRFRRARESAPARPRLGSNGSDRERGARHPRLPGGGVGPTRPSMGRACLCGDVINCEVFTGDAGWSSPVARWAHNPKVAGSNPAPATIDTCSGRSPVSGDLLLCTVAPSIAARFPFSSILSSPWSGVITMASISPRSASVASVRVSGRSRPAPRRDFSCGRGRPSRYPLSGVGILHVAQAVPHEPTDVELVVQDPCPALGVPVDRARAPGARYRETITSRDGCLSSQPSPWRSSFSTSSSPTQ
jgi:hypothetical protein